MIMITLLDRTVSRVLTLQRGQTAPTDALPALDGKERQHRQALGMITGNGLKVPTFVPGVHESAKPR